MSESTLPVDLAAYLSPEWSLSESEGMPSEATALQDSVVDGVAAELVGYVLAFLKARDPAISTSDEEAVANLIHQHRHENSTYCRRILSWLVSSRGGGGASQALADDYMNYAPGPFREAVLLGHFISASATTKGGAREGSGVTEVDDDSEETGSTFTANTDYSALTGSGSATKAKVKKLVALCNKYKAECALLRDRLLEMRANDIEMLQDKYRGAQLDLQKIKSRNLELKDRVQMLEAQLHEALMASSSKSSKRNPGRQPRTEMPDEDAEGAFRDALGAPPLLGKPNAASGAVAEEAVALRRQVKSLEARVLSLQAAAVAPAPKAATAATAVATASNQSKDGAAPAAMKKTVKIADPVSRGPATDAPAPAVQPPPPLLTTFSTLSLPQASQEKLSAALNAWIDFEVASSREVDRKVIQGLLEELRGGGANSDGSSPAPSSSSSSSAASATGSALASRSSEDVGKSKSSARIPLKGKDSSRQQGARGAIWAFLLGGLLVIAGQSVQGQKISLSDLAEGLGWALRWLNEIGLPAAFACAAWCGREAHALLQIIAAAAAGK